VRAVWTSSLEASWSSNGAALGSSPDPRPPTAMREVNSWGGREVREVVRRGPAVILED
jgi:hypothetical protein